MLRDLRFGPEQRRPGSSDLAHDLLQLVDERGEIGRLAEPGAEEIKQGAHHKQGDPIGSTD
jgi:hypothetical protein